MFTEDYIRYNSSKPKFVRQWMTFYFTHPDNEPLGLVAIPQGIEPDLSTYTFEGIEYQPSSMSVELPNESSDSNGKITITFPRAGATVKRFMANITPQNAKTPIGALFRIYQEGISTPVRTYDGDVSVNYPVVSGNDVSIQIDIYNPSLLTSQRIVTISKYPELRTA